MKEYILLITLHADPAMPPGYNEWGGTHTYMRELLDEYGKRNVPCILITRKSMRQLPDTEQFNDSCTIFRIHSGEPEPMDKTMLKEYHQEHLKQIQEIVAQQETPPQVIHSVYWNSGRLAMELSRTLNIPFVHSIISNSRGRVARGAFEPIPGRAHYEQEIYDAATCLICVSEDEGHDLVRFYQVPEEKIVIAGQYIHAAFLSPAHDFNGFPRMNSHIAPQTQKEIADTYNDLCRTDGTDDYWVQKAFTYIGRMDMNKGLDHIFQAWHELFKRYGNICPSLWLVGGSLPEIEVIRKQVKQVIPDLTKLEQAGKILWWGYLDCEGLSTVLLKSSVLVTHSLYEPGGRVAVEAMGEGVPVLATPNGFAKDSVTDWREGFLVEYGDVEGLSLRMEHFIRQPYLSNALGLNAKHTAERVITQWDFIGHHLACCGYVSAVGSGSEPLSEQIEGRKKINLFPYFNEPYSQSLISDFFRRCTGENVGGLWQGTEGSYTSDIWQIAGTNGAYIVKRTFTRLATSPLFNPICSNRYARRADKHYQVELKAYQRQNSQVLLGHDDLHYLLLLKKLDAYEVTQKEDLKPCIEFLLTRPNMLTPKEAERFCQIIGQPADTLPELATIMEHLDHELDDYYFEVSGIFSNRLCWKIARHMIAYNRRSMDQKQLKQMESYAAFYAAIPAVLCSSRLRDINTDTEIKHFKMLDGAIHMIDFEKVSIGTAEMDMAGLFFDYLFNHGDSDGSFWPWAIKTLQACSEIDLQALFVNTAFRFFYECIVRTVMYRVTPQVCMEQLEHITRLIHEYGV